MGQVVEKHLTQQVGNKNGTREVWGSDFLLEIDLDHIRPRWLRMNPRNFFCNAIKSSYSSFWQQQPKGKKEKKKKAYVELKWRGKCDASVLSFTGGFFFSFWGQYAVRSCDTKQQTVLNLYIKREEFLLHVCLTRL